MTDITRRAVSYIAGRIVSNVISSSIYDFQKSKHYFFSGQVENSQVSIYDHEEQCHISGNLPSIYHFGNGNYITINTLGATFKGFDFDTSSHFSGTVTGRNVSIYDSQLGQYFNYSI